MPSTDPFVKLHVLARALRLPEKWLREEAVKGRIPCIQVGSRMAFDIEAVRQALIAAAREGMANGPRS